LPPFINSAECLLDHREMDGSESGRNLHLAIAGIPLSDGADRPFVLDEYRCQNSVCRLVGSDRSLSGGKKFKARVTARNQNFNVRP